MLLSSGEDGTPLALLEASAVTAIRTAAVSGLATRLLARDDAGDLALALIGAGVQARTHLAAMACVRSLRRLRIAARRSERARALAAEARCPFPVETVESVEAAVRGADIVVTVTSSAEPVLERAWIAAGAHVNAVGSSRPSAREIDTGTLFKSLGLAVEDLAAAEHVYRKARESGAGTRAGF